MYMKGIKKPAMIISFIFALAFLMAAGNSGAQEGGADAIAVRIIPNPNHYSISRWYAGQGFTGSPQALTVNGYEAIRDGRTVYVNAANIDQGARTIYTNIYLISYNQDSAAPTVDILGQIIAHWKFNDNITESVGPAPACSISALNCASDTDCGSGQSCALAGPSAASCVLKNPKNCATDADCPTNFFCDGLKAKVTRDIKRVGRLEELREALYNFKQVNKHYPTLAAGTYVPNNSLSVWPSWNQVLLSDVAVSQSFADPINKIGKCLADAAVKNGIDYSAAVTGCSMDSGLTTASCSNATWNYDFTLSSGGNHRLWIETTNANNGGIYGDLSTFAPVSGGEDVCPEPGVQHHLSVYVDGALKGAACNPAVNPDKPRQTAYVDLGNLAAGGHTIRIQWSNDWTYSPNGDSNLRIYRLGLTASDPFDLKTCWDQNSKKFAYGSAGPTLTLPAASYVFAYASDANGSQYNLCATLESRALGYRFNPFDLADSACVSAAGVAVGGQAGNSAPRIVNQSLVGEANQPFSGFIQVMDAEGNPLQWSITNGNPMYWGSWNGGSARPPVLQDTSNPYQKKVYADAAGVPGSYNLSLTIDDGQGGVLVTTTPITIFSSLISLTADNAEYVLDPTVPFNYTLAFISNNLANPSADYSVTKLSGPAGIDILADLTKNFSSLGSGRYQVKYSDTIPTADQFANDTDFRYRLAVTDQYGKTATKDFTIRLKVENPRMDFSCADTARVLEGYSCALGPRSQGNHDITYSVSRLPDGLSLIVPIVQVRNNDFHDFLTRGFYKLRDWLLSFVSAAAGNDYVISGAPTGIGRHTITVTAVNEYGATAVKSFTLKVNNFCGDDAKQSPNTEGRGGLYNDGQEDCDGTGGVTTNPADSRIDLQYGCTSGAGTPNPILTNDQCVYKSPLKGGGYCGDGYCQFKIDGQSRENCWKCPTDCGECAATIAAVAQEESVAYFNGRRQYQSVWPNQGVATRTLVRGNNVFGFWSHVTSGAAGFAYRILIGPVDEPYDVLDTTNSRLSCAAASAPSSWLAPSGYDPASELTNNGYNWPENNFSETGFAPSKVWLLSAFSPSPLVQVNIPGQSVNAAYLPYLWGTAPAPVPSAFYCRLQYTYDLSNLGLCRSRCEDRDCGADGCGATCGNRVGNATCSSPGSICTSGTSYECCAPLYPAVCGPVADGCGNTRVNACYTYSGEINDYMTSDPLSDVSMVVKNGSGVTVGSATTDGSGHYSIGGILNTGGNYTITASSAGYQNGTETFTADSDKTFDFILSSSALSGAARIQLTWGATPTDLDSHLKFSTYHISYGNKGVLTGNAILDVDDTTGYGPENIRIESFLAGATYRYFIHDYTNSCNFTGATVDVYNGGGRKVRTYTGVDNPGKCYWSVFNMSDTGVITNVNVYTNVSP
jgi:hypothetical protein